MAHHPRRRPSTGRSAVYAEDRHLRRVAESRRRPARRSVVLWLLLFPILVTGVTVGALVAFVGALALIFSIAAIVMIPTLLVGAAVFAAHRRRLRHAPGTAPLQGRRAAAPRPALVWSSSRERFRALAAAYAAHECDPMNVLRLPALSDVTVPSTARFVDAFAEAQAYETDEHPGDEHAAAFVRAADRAERAWRAARNAAERIRLSGLTPAERHTVERVIKLLTTARDSDSEPERLAAYNRARTELDRLDAAGVVHLPRTARAVLDTAARGTLPA